MVTTTQEHINGAARFQADNAGDDTVAGCVAALLELERQDNGYLQAVAEARRAGVVDVEPIYREWKPRRVEAAKKLYEWTEEEVEQAENAVAAMRTKAKDDAFRNAVKRATKTPEEKAAILRTHAEKCMQAGNIEAAASWLRLAARVERGQRLD